MMAHPFWYNVHNLLPQMVNNHLMRSEEVLAKDKDDVIRVAFVQYSEDHKPQWKLAARDFYDFDNVCWWMPLRFLP